VALILRSPASFGYLSWARNLAYQPKKVMDSVIRVTFPVYARLQDKEGVLAQALSKTYFLLSVLIFPAITGICFLIRPFIAYLYGGSKWEPAIPAVYLLSLTLLWGVFNSVATNALSAIGKIKIVLKFMVLVTLATWLLTPVFTYLWGFTGATLAWVLAGFTSLWSLQKCFQEIKINLWTDVRGAIYSSLVMGLIVYPLGKFWIASLVQLLLVVGAGIFVYAGVLYLLEKERLVEEFRYFFQKLSR
jgi:O-antigen/teichoic acid export membrane protein